MECVCVVSHNGLCVVFCVVCSMDINNFMVHGVLSLNDVRCVGFISYSILENLRIGVSNMNISHSFKEFTRLFGWGADFSCAASLRRLQKLLGAGILNARRLRII